MAMNTRSRVPGRAIKLLLCLTVAGCTVGPNYHKPAAWYSPAEWFHARKPLAPVAAGPSLPVEAAIDPVWWNSFHDPILSRLIDRVAGANLDVRVQTIRLAESRASLGIARADAFPQINGNTSYTREQQSKRGVIGLFGGGAGAGTPGTASNGLGGIQGGVPNTVLSAPFDLYQYGFDASYELDLWGRVRRNIESSRAQLAASEEDRRNTLLTALSELARDYVQLRGAQADLAIVRRNLSLQRDSLQLTRDRAQAGLNTELDVANAAAQVAATESQVPDLEAQAAQQVNAIALLLGEPPDALDSKLAAATPIPPVPPTVPVGLPSELARRRPDIRQAEANLHAATATVGVAVADFFPRVTLSGSIAIQATQVKYLGSLGSDTYSLGPSITLPIFQGGRLTRTLELRRAQQQEAAIGYQRAVLNALHDVNNALTTYASEQLRQQALQRSVRENQRAVGLANDQYRAGIVTFIEVLNAEQQLLSTQQQQLQSQTNISTDLVALYKALGGGWEVSYPDGAPPPGGTSLIPAALVEP